MMENKKIIEKINECIGKLVYDKVHIKKAYNYYHCIRDVDQFRHIEENYGIGVPTSVGFTPLIKKHIDVLVGEYLELDPDLQITCKDSKTVSNILRDKKLKIDKALYDHLQSYLQNAVVNIMLGDKQPQNDPYIEKELQQIKTDIENSFVSEYEIAAQNILQYIKCSRDIDIKNKARELITDLLVSGTAYYRVKPSSNESNIKLEVLNPLDTFVERNRNYFYLNKSPRAVIRRYLPIEQVLVEYGEELSSDAKKKLEKMIHQDTRNDSGFYVRIPNNLLYDEDTQKTKIANLPSAGLLGGLEVSPILPYETEANHYASLDTITVYECEWLEWNGDKLERHEGVKIGDEIYICRGKSKYTTRSMSDPNDCTLSINGMFFSDKNGQPFSLIANTMDLQD